MAAFRRTPAGRPVPVTLAAVFAADSGRPASTDTRPGLRKRRRTARRCRSVRLRSDLDTAPRRPPSRPDGSPGGRSSAPTADTLAVSAGAACRAADTLVWTPGGVEGPPPPQTPRRRRPVPTAAAGRRTGRSATGGRHVPPAQGAAAVSAVASGRPASTRPHSQTHRGHCRGVRFRGHLLGLRARSAPPADIDGPEVWTADAAGGHWQPAGARRCGHPRLRQGRADTTATPRWTAGSTTVHRPPNVGPGTGPQGAASASTAMA